MQRWHGTRFSFLRNAFRPPLAQFSFEHSQTLLEVEVVGPERGSDREVLARFLETPPSRERHGQVSMDFRGKRIELEGARVARDRAVDPSQRVEREPEAVMGGREILLQPDRSGVPVRSSRGPP